VITDGLASYRPACGEEYTHQPEPIGPSGQQAHELLPGVHRVASLAQRWLLGTHQGGVKPGHIQAYLDEFTFRFNRRLTRQRHAVLPPPRTGRALPHRVPTAHSSSIPTPDAGTRSHHRRTSASAPQAWTATPSIDHGDRRKHAAARDDPPNYCTEMEDPYDRAGYPLRSPDSFGALIMRPIDW